MSTSMLSRLLADAAELDTAEFISEVGVNGARSEVRIRSLVLIGMNKEQMETLTADLNEVIANVLKKRANGIRAYVRKELEYL